MLDVTDRKALAKAVLPFDLIIGAVPGALGFATLRTVIEAGRNVVDISFFPEDPLALDEIATGSVISIRGSGAPKPIRSNASAISVAKKDRKSVV